MISIDCAKRRSILSPEKIPAHIAVIMDGNGRWAKQRNLSRSKGHRAGADAAKTVITACRRMGVKHLTMYAFSTENWGRPDKEVRFLFELLVDFLRKELPTLLENDIKLSVLGDWSALPLTSRTVLGHALKKTAKCSSMTLNLALNYSGRDEILKACKELIKEGTAPEDLDEEALASRLYTAGQPDPDLLIRTSGEMRLSNFLLFQAAYSEFYFTETLWPDFGEEELEKAVEEYGRRKRRFGLTQEQKDLKEQAET